MNDEKKLTVGSLFSGIGGLELGLERTGGFRTIWNSEIDPYASAVLRKHWPSVPNLGDITKIDWTRVERPDLICGGFPCQDISTAGKGAGIKEGTRSGLWFEFHKAICVLRPKYALVENVSALSFRGLCIVLGNLTEAGYNAEWFTLQARDVGAPHKRERLFIVAHARGGGRDDWTNNRRAGHLPHPEERGDAESHEERNGRFARSDEDADANPSDSERIGLERLVAQKVRRFPEFRSFENVHRVEDFVSRPDIPQPLIRGGDNGVPRWVDRIKCLGNAIVPQVAQVIGEAILENEKTRANE